jgi:hypothetical protein
MVHLGIAFRLAIPLDRFPSSAFLLGSIAPDAIHMRVGADSAAKQIVHLNEPPDTTENDAIRELLHQHSQMETPLLHFAAGYAAHLLADRLWSRTIVQPMQARCATLMDAPALRELYYLETDQLDFNLYHQMSWRPQAWDLLKRAVAPDFPPMLIAQEIDLWRQKTLRWFNELKQEPKIVPQYITDSDVASYTHEAVEAIGQQFSTWSLYNYRTYARREN